MQNAQALQLPEAFSGVLGLGAPLAFFPVKKANRWGSLIGGLIFLLGALLAFLYGLYDTYKWWQDHGPVVIGEHITIPLLISGILFLLGAACSWSAYANWPKAVVVYDAGFVYNDRKGLQIWRWQDVISLFLAITRHYTNGIYTGTTYMYSLFKPDKSKLVFDNKFKDIEALGNLIGQKVFPFQYQHAADTYNAGHTLTLGPVAISKSGIAIGKKTYAWQEVGQVSIHQGYLRVSKKDGGWFSGASAMASTIPNLSVLLNFINQAVGIKTGK